jgi:hypothetical protein
VTDSPDPIRRDSSREPATIEGEATVIDDGTPTSATQAEFAAETGGASEAEGTAAEWPHEPGPSAEGDSVSQSPDPPPPPVYEPRPEPRRTSFAAVAGSGLLGGLIGAGAVLAYQMTRPATPSTEDPRVAQIQQQLGNLPRADVLQALEGRIAGLERARGEVDQRIAAAQAVAERAAARAEEALSRPAPAAPAQPPDNTAALGELTNRLAALEGQVREAGTARQGVEQRIGEVAQRAAAFDRRLAEVDQRAAGLDQRLGQITEQVPQLSQQVAGLSGRLAELRPDAIRAGLRVVLADRLNDALAHGIPYPEILDSLRQFEAKPERVAALEPLAQSGAPTAASLVQSFKPVGERILRENRGESQGVADRLLGMFERVVTIRHVDDRGSGSPAALVARIDDALERGALADAAAAWDSLPEAARRVSEDWGRQLKARVAAERAAREIATDAIAALNAPAR